MTPQEIKTGDLVKMWDGSFGRVVGITQDGWFKVKDLSHGDRVDEWQGFQLTLRAKADGRIL